MSKDNTELYFVAWEALHPTMRSLLSQLNDMVMEALSEGMVQALPEEQIGDEEFRLCRDWKLHDDNDEESIVGCDIKLVDGLVHGEEEPGFAVSLEIQGYGGRAMGTIAPKNYTPEMFTLDLEELRSRLQSIEAGLPEVADIIVNHLNTHKDANRPMPR